MDSLALVLNDPAADIVVIVFFLVAGFLWGTLGGKSKLLAFMFATYLALFMGPIVMEAVRSQGMATDATKDLIIYLAVLVVLFVYFDRVVFRVFSKTAYRWWQALLFSFLTVGLFVAGTLNLVNVRGIIEISKTTESLFTGTGPYVFWIFAPLIGLFFIARSRA